MGKSRSGDEGNCAKLKSKIRTLQRENSRLKSENKKLINLISSIGEDSCRIIDKKCPNCHSPSMNRITINDLTIVHCEKCDYRNKLNERVSSTS